jgi:hypothetical protein
VVPVWCPKRTRARQKLDGNEAVQADVTAFHTTSISPPPSGGGEFLLGQLANEAVI